MWRAVKRSARWFLSLLPESAFARMAGLLLIAVTIWICALDPFGLDTRAESVADALSQRLLAGEYGEGARARILLVVQDAEGLENGTSRLTIPLPYQAQADLVEIATAYGARAIFLDFNYRARADATAVGAAGFRQLVRAIGAANAQHIPVFAGTIANRPDLQPLRSVVRTTGLSPTTDHPADYSLIDPETQARLAAADLYLAACRSPAYAECDPALVRSVRSGAVPPLAIRFGTADPRDGDNCETGGLVKRLWDGLKGDPQPLPCVLHEALTIDRALDMSSDADLRQLFGDRIVMIGLGSNMGDDSTIPGIGRLPGVAIHAMALDNLLTLGSDYPRWPADYWQRFGGDDLLKLAILVVPPLVLRRAAHGYRRFGPRRRGLRMVGATIGMFAAAIALSYTASALGHWPVAITVLAVPLWAGVVALSADGDYAHAILPPEAGILNWVAAILLLLLLAACLVLFGAG